MPFTNGNDSENQQSNRSNRSKMFERLSKGYRRARSVGPTFKTLTNSRKNSDSDFASIFYLPTSPTRKFPAFNQLEISGLPASSKPLPTVSIDENKQK